MSDLRSPRVNPFAGVEALVEGADEGLESIDMAYPRPLRVGELIEGRYHLLELLSNPVNEKSQVFLAEDISDPANPKPCVVKFVLSYVKAMDGSNVEGDTRRGLEQMLARFRQEVAVLMDLSGRSPHGVKVLAAVERRLMMVMDFFDCAGTVHDWLDTLNNAGLSVHSREAVIVGLQVADALRSMHASGNLHRDVKPANVLISHYDTNQKPVPERGGETCLHAKLIDTTFSGPPDFLRKAPDQALIMGTLTYIAPESFKGEYSVQTDIYQFGAFLYELISGEAIFDFSRLPRTNKRDFYQKMVALKNQQVVCRFPEGTNQLLKLLIAQCIDPDPNNRPRTMEDVIGLLVKAMEHIDTEEAQDRMVEENYLQLSA